MKKLIVVFFFFSFSQLVYTKSALEPFKLSEESKGQNLEGKEESERVQKKWKEIERKLSKLLGLEKETIDLKVLSELTEMIEVNLSAHSFGLHCSKDIKADLGPVESGENDAEEEDDEENDENFGDYKPSLKGRSIASKGRNAKELLQILTSRKPEIVCLAKAQMAIFKALDNYNRAFDSSPSVYIFKGESECKIGNKRFCEWKKLIDRRLQIMESLSFIIGRLRAVKIFYNPLHPYTLLYVHRGINLKKLYEKDEVTTAFGSLVNPSKLGGHGKDLYDGSFLWAGLARTYSTRYKKIIKYSSNLGISKVHYKPKYVFQSLKAFESVFLEPINQIDGPKKVKDLFCLELSYHKRFNPGFSIKETVMENLTSLKTRYLNIYKKIPMNTKCSGEKDNDYWSLRMHDYLRDLYNFQMTRFYLEKSNYEANTPNKKVSARNYLYQSLEKKHIDALISRDSNRNKKEDYRAHYGDIDRFKEKKLLSINKAVKSVVKSSGTDIHKVVEIYNIKPGFYSQRTLPRVRSRNLIADRIYAHPLAKLDGYSFDITASCFFNLWVDVSGKPFDGVADAEKMDNKIEIKNDSKAKDCFAPKGIYKKSATIHEKKWWSKKKGFFNSPLLIGVGGRHKNICGRGHWIKFVDFKEEKIIPLKSHCFANSPCLKGKFGSCGDTIEE